MFQEKKANFKHYQHPLTPFHDDGFLTMRQNVV